MAHDCRGWCSGRTGCTLLLRSQIPEPRRPRCGYLTSRSALYPRARAKTNEKITALLLPGVVVRQPPMASGTLLYQRPRPLQLTFIVPTHPCSEHTLPLAQDSKLRGSERVRPAPPLLKRAGSSSPRRCQRPSASASASASGASTSRARHPACEGPHHPCSPPAFRCVVARLSRNAGLQL